jgi:hypothetical protein
MPQWGRTSPVPDGFIRPQVLLLASSRPRSICVSVTPSTAALAFALHVVNPVEHEAR